MLSRAVLLIGAPSVDLDCLADILKHDGFRVQRAEDLDEARPLLRQTQFQMAIADRELPDGGWTTLLRSLSERPQAPELVVYARVADEWLWAEVLTRGGFDVLGAPLDECEVLRVAKLADQSWRSRNRGSIKAPLLMVKTA